jgi:hypothetical protein
MTTTTNKTGDAAQERKKPHYVAKSPKGQGRGSRLERIGVAWNREDGGICLRLAGAQIVDGDIYIYPITATAAESEDGE